MPIHLDSHTAEVDLTPGTTKSDIVEFLYRHPAYGYRPAEVAEKLEIPQGTATTTLKRLYESGYLGKTPDSYYHALEEQESVRRYLSSLEQVSKMFEHDTVPDSKDDSAIDAETTQRELSDDEIESELRNIEADIEAEDE